MFKVSNPICTPPETFSSALQQKVYSTFQDLSIPFERVDTDPGLTMEDCQHIDAKIGVRIVKTVFLCNRQQTAFYLYVTTDDKPFVISVARWGFPASLSLRPTNSGNSPA